MSENQEHAAVAYAKEQMEMGLNFSCLLFLFTEMMGLFNELTRVLNQKEVLTKEEVQQVFDITANKEELEKIYNAVVERYVQYYGIAKHNMAQGQTFSAPAEKSPTDETPQQ